MRCTDLLKPCSSRAAPIILTLQLELNESLCFIQTFPETSISATRLCSSSPDTFHRKSLFILWFKKNKIKIRELNPETQLLHSLSKVIFLSVKHQRVCKHVVLCRTAVHCIIIKPDEAPKPVHEHKRNISKAWERKKTADLRKSAKTIVAELALAGLDVSRTGGRMLGLEKSWDFPLILAELNLDFSKKQRHTSDYPGDQFVSILIQCNLPTTPFWCKKKMDGWIVRERDRGECKQLGVNAEPYFPVLDGFVRRLSRCRFERLHCSGPAFVFCFTLYDFVLFSQHQPLSDAHPARELPLCAEIFSNVGKICPGPPNRHWNYRATSHLRWTRAMNVCMLTLSEQSSIQ